MLTKKKLKSYCTIRPYKFTISIFFFFALGLNSCHNLTCTDKVKDNEEIKFPPYYHVELKNGEENFDAIDLKVKKTGDKNVLYGIRIKDKKMFMDLKLAKRANVNKTIERLISQNRFEIELVPSYEDVINRITIFSDPDVPPKDTVLQCEDCITCWRDRNCIGESTGFIDKIELRGMAGYRLNANQSIHYPGPSGGTTYKKETFSFERGGTDITVGFEASGLFQIDYLSNGRDNFHLGIMTGIWPVDGSTFIPLAIHPRYTFDDVPDHLNCDCNAWYIFGDLGIVLDPTGEVPLYCNEDCNETILSSFWDIGIGYDMWLTKCMDFSIDVGFRRTQLPLPANEECEECSGVNGKYPVRLSNQIFLRLGLTW